MRNNPYLSPAEESRVISEQSTRYGRIIGPAIQVACLTCGKREWVGSVYPNSGMVADRQSATRGCESRAPPVRSVPDAIPGRSNKYTRELERVRAELQEIAS